MPKLEKSCGAIIYYKKENKFYFLVQKHQNGGHWAFAKGHTENNESEIQTALREIKEETQLTNIKLNTDFRVTTTYKPKKGVLKKVVYFMGKINITQLRQVKKQISEISEIKWLPYSRAVKLITYKDDKNILEKAFNYLKNKK